MLVKALPYGSLFKFVMPVCEFFQQGKDAIAHMKDVAFFFFFFFFFYRFLDYIGYNFFVLPFISYMVKGSKNEQENSNRELPILGSTNLKSIIRNFDSAKKIYRSR
ncbi:hypothetical protein POVWA2_059290 [Plasmodium ovale wallikeri]|uniref:Uncharacterized protein n=1 Tax=Plasmodium ovale wallikeri TaxID=864142 RepID=A0A1A9A1F9_PLAOA|nr:hypothetical protein POVWA2_059290 [Plasmodium ovale wallikeri]